MIHNCLAELALSNLQPEKKIILAETGISGLPPANCHRITEGTLKIISLHPLAMGRDIMAWSLSDFLRVNNFWEMFSAALAGPGVRDAVHLVVCINPISVLAG